VQRNSSNTPLQALTLWNDPAFFECSQSFGRRILNDVPAMADSAATVRQRAIHAFVLCMTRQPTESELNELMQLHRSQQTLAEKQPDLATKLCGLSALPAGATTADLAAWIVIGRTLMNLDEFITRE
jgi:hypothetical protein